MSTVAPSLSILRAWRDPMDPAPTTNTFASQPGNDLLGCTYRAPSTHKPPRCPVQATPSGKVTSQGNGSVAGMSQVHENRGFSRSCSRSGTPLVVGDRDNDGRTTKSESLKKGHAAPRDNQVGISQFLAEPFRGPH